MADPALNPQESRTVQELSLPIYQAKGWLKFLGMLSILGGILQALSVIGLLWAWLPIWMGVLLFQAGSSSELARAGDGQSFLRSLGSLKTYFVLNGVLSLLAILFGLATLCITIVLPLIGITLIPWQELFDQVQYYNY